MYVSLPLSPLNHLSDPYKLRIPRNQHFSPRFMTSHAFLIDFIVRDKDNLIQFFSTYLTSSLPRTIVSKLLELTITVFEISVLTWLPYRFYCARRGQFIPISRSRFLVTNYPAQ